MQCFWNQWKVFWITSIVVVAMSLIVTHVTGFSGSKSSTKSIGIVLSKWKISIFYTEVFIKIESRPKCAYISTTWCIRTSRNEYTFCIRSLNNAKCPYPFQVPYFLCLMFSFNNLTFGFSYPLFWSQLAKQSLKLKIACCF